MAEEPAECGTAPAKDSEQNCSSLKRTCLLPHYLPNRELEEEPTIDDEKGVEWPQFPSVIPVWYDLDNPALGPLYNVCVLREGS